MMQYLSQLDDKNNGPSSSSSLTRLSRLMPTQSGFTKQMLSQKIIDVTSKMRIMQFIGGLPSNVFSGVNFNITSTLVCVKRVLEIQKKKNTYYMRWKSMVIEMTIIDVMIMVIIVSLSVSIFKYSKFFCSYSDYLKPLQALVLNFNFSVPIIHAAI